MRNTTLGSHAKKWFLAGCFVGAMMAVIHLSPQGNDRYELLQHEPKGTDIKNDTKIRAINGITSVRNSYSSRNITSWNVPKINLSCQKLFDRDDQEIKNAKHLLHSRKYTIPSDKSFIKPSMDCEHFLRVRGYHTKPLSPEEEEYPIAFGLRIHRNVAQVERLLRAVYMPQNIYCVYIDKKSDAKFHLAMKGIIDCLPNVFLASNLEDFYYGSYSAVQSDLQCMSELVSSNISWKYFINLSGQEFPLRTNLELVRILKYLNGTNDIESYPFPPRYSNRFQTKFKVIDGLFSDSLQPKEQLPDSNIALRKGCSYNTFSKKFVKWVLEDKKVQYFLDWTKDTYAPDEIVWATINYWPNAPGGYPLSVTQTAKTFLSREIIWTYSSDYCFGKFVRSVCMFSVEDLKTLSGRWELFANKFDIAYDHIAFDCMEEKIRERTTNPQPDTNINWDHIVKSPHVLYHKLKEKGLPLDENLQALIKDNKTYNGM